MRFLIAEKNSFITGFFYNFPREIEVKVKFAEVQNFILSTGEFIETDEHYPLMLEFEFIIPPDYTPLMKACISDALWDLSGKSSEKEKGIYGIILNNKEKQMFHNWYRYNEELGFLLDLIVIDYL